MYKLRFKFATADQICALHINFANGPWPGKSDEGWRSGRELPPAPTEKRIIRNFAGCQNTVYNSTYVAEPFSGAESAVKRWKYLHLGRHDRLVGRHFETRKVDQSSAAGQYQFRVPIPIWATFGWLCFEVIVTSYAG